MILIEKTKIDGWETAIRGMRNPMNSWENSDSGSCVDFKKVYYDGDVGCDNKCPIYSETSYCGYSEKFRDDSSLSGYLIGPNDLNLMTKLANAGTDHGKFLRFIVVTCDITAPLYWWKEYDTYKVGTVANSCSTMHKIHEKEFTIDDFSHEHLMQNKSLDDENRLGISDAEGYEYYLPSDILECWIVQSLNVFRQEYIKTGDKQYWWQMIQLLPSSYNQKRTVLLNYAVLRNMYHARKDHKLDEWRDFCTWIENLPYAKKLIIGEVKR